MKFSDILLSYIGEKLSADTNVRESLSDFAAKVPVDIMQQDFDETVDFEKHKKGTGEAVYVYGLKTGRECFLEMYAFADDDEPTIAVYSAANPPVVSFFTMDIDKAVAVKFTIAEDGSVKRDSKVSPTEPSQVPPTDDLDEEE